MNCDIYPAMKMNSCCMYQHGQPLKTMLSKKSARILQHACVMMTLAIVLADLPRWAAAAAMIPAIVLLADCVRVWIKGGRMK